MALLRNLALILALLIYPLISLRGRLITLGAFRAPSPSISIFPHVLESFVVPGIIQAEDFAHHLPSGLIILTAPTNESSRYGWWPPVGNLHRREDAVTADGGIWTLDPKTWEARRIPITGLKGPFVTHGLDIYTPPNDPNTFYLHAVNHRPSLSGPESFNSTIEIFKIDLSSSTATHLQTISHPLIYTPNDIYSISPTEFLVSNDHHILQGGLRGAEDLLTFALARKTNIVRISASGDQVDGRIVKSGIHSANGLGHTPSGRIIFNSAAGGVMHLLKSVDDLSTVEEVAFESTLDNPTYFSDDQAEGGSDASGYILAGLAKASKLHEHVNDPTAVAPSIIWISRQRKDGSWEKRKLVEDDGHWCSGATTAMLLPVQGPKGGKREFWLIATGLLAKGVAVARVDLTDWAESA